MLQSKPQPNAVTAVVGCNTVAERYTAEPFVKVPTAAAIHTAGASGRSYGIGLVFGTIASIPILAPLMDIAAHVKQHQLVGHAGGNGVRAVRSRAPDLPRVIAGIPCHVVNVVATGILESLALVATTSSKFPFCLGGKSEIPAGYLVQCDDEFLASLPRYILHWVLISDQGAWIVTRHPYP